MTTVPQRVTGCDLHRGVLAVGADDGLAPVRADGSIGAGPDPVSFGPGPPPLARGRRFGPCSTALAGSRVVQVALWMTRDSPWNAASPVPWTTRPGNASASSLTICAASCDWEAVPCRATAGTALAARPSTGRTAAAPPAPRPPTYCRRRSSSRPGQPRHRPTAPRPRIGSGACNTRGLAVRNRAQADDPRAPRAGQAKRGVLVNPLADRGPAERARRGLCARPAMPGTQGIPGVPAREAPRGKALVEGECQG